MTMSPYEDNERYRLVRRSRISNPQYLHPLNVNDMHIGAGPSRMTLLIGQTAVLIFFTNAYRPMTLEKNDNIQFVPTGYIYS